MSEKIDEIGKDAVPVDFMIDRADQLVEDAIKSYSAEKKKEADFRAIYAELKALKKRMDILEAEVRT